MFLIIFYAGSQLLTSHINFRDPLGEPIQSTLGTSEFYQLYRELKGAKSLKTQPK